MGGEESRFARGEEKQGDRSLVDLRKMTVVLSTEVEMR
jgi:hypothetical protein